MLERFIRANPFWGINCQHLVDKIFGFRGYGVPLRRGILEKNWHIIVWIKTNNNSKWLFYSYFWPFSRQLYVCLSQNWSSDGHFDVLCVSISSLDQKLQHIISQKHFFHAWKCIISGLVCQSEFWLLLSKSALIQGISLQSG